MIKETNYYKLIHSLTVWFQEELDYLEITEEKPITHGG